MNLQLESPFLQFEADLDNRLWHVQTAGDGGNLRAASGAAAYRSGDRRRSLSWQAGSNLAVEKTLFELPAGGLSAGARLRQPPNQDGLACIWNFALLADAPLLLWQLVLENRGSLSLDIERLELLRLGASAGSVELPGGWQAPAFFANGWQSWSSAGVLLPYQRPRGTRLGPLRRPTTQHDGARRRPRRAGLFSSDMFGVLGDQNTRRGLLLGFLSQAQHFGTFEVDLRHKQPQVSLWANGDLARLEPGARIESDWACLQFLNLDDLEPLETYLQAVARQHSLAPLPLQAPAPTGWCSWYQFSSSDYQGTITPADLKRNLVALADHRTELALDIFQIDDGYQSKIGDWFTFSAPFSTGIADLAQDIRAAGFTPGLWLAPFIVHPRSRLAADQPGWLLRSRSGRVVNAGYFWDAFTQALDLTQPDALAYAAETVHNAAHKWGIPYIKLDFLFAAALPGSYRDPSRTRAQVLRAGLQALRAAAGEFTFLLGCGCPLGPAIGLVDGMRIGADTAGRWRPAFRGIEHFIAPEPDLPAARNALHNALTRTALHRRWWLNDPDCLQLRETTHLTLNEVQSAASVIGLSGGSFFISDEIGVLSPERLRLLHSLLPPIGQRPRVLDWFAAGTPQRLRLDLQGAAGNWHLLAWFNWSESAQHPAMNLADFDLDPALAWWGRDFWPGVDRRPAAPVFADSGAGSFEPREIPSHGVRLLAVRQHSPGLPAYLGSDLHISQGLEVSRLSLHPGTDKTTRLSLRLERPGDTHGTVDVFVPANEVHVASQGSAAYPPRKTLETASGIIRLPVAFQGSLDIELLWETK